jgi:hypothetical protein
MSIFNPDTFLDEDAGGPLSTERVLIPIDTYKNCYIETVKPVEGIIKDGERAGEPWAKMNFVWVIDDQEVKDKLDRQRVVVTQGIMLELDATGSLDEGKGKNVRLGKLRAALGINSGKVRWRDFIGVPATISIGHATSDKGTMYEEVTAVAGH